MDQLFNRKYTVQGLFIIVALILLGKLFYIQIVSDKYFLSAESNVLRKIYKYPARGAILDRNMKVIVQNEPVYDLMVIPNEVKPFDTLALAKALDITIEDVRKNLRKARGKSSYQSTPFLKQISVQSYARLQEIMYRFPGFRTQDRTVRHYPDSVAGQLFGYVREVSDDDIEKSDGYYKPGDYKGKSGLERSYEEVLRGERGVINTVYDARNTPQGSYADGKYDINAVSGERLISGIDIQVQKLGEELMKNKVGAIVAIEPSSGEILALVSSPGYDPNLLVGRDQGNNYMDLIGNPYRPSLVRPIQGYYPPGSSFKPIDALIGLQDGVIDPNTTFFCPGYYMAGNHKVKCEHVDGSISMRKGIARSCNTYFCNVFQKLITKNGMKNQRQTYQEWRDKIAKFGFGSKLEVDIPFERKGYFYNADHYDKIYGKRWGYTTVISQAIGQGEITATPLQIANAMAIIANRGYYIKPHLIKAMGDKNLIKKDYVAKNYVGVDAKHFEPVIDGMQDCVNSPWGTATLSRIPDIILCGKTGTVQNPHGKNHSVFIGFAPRDNPKIAIAVIVENAGYGSTYAAPIASYMVEKYIKRNVSGSRASQVEWMKNQNLLPALIDKAKKMKLTKADSLIIKKTDSLKRLKDSLKIKSANLKTSSVAKPNMLKAPDLSAVKTEIQKQ
ncbi:penicillin-binding protein 2 [Pedobacter rhizosphaerae]|uniref:Penicillin-binding protein 2 n=1 Tax=Pedobacter rhizosphaerae TaxID=390241 RepID=A0A1H9QBM5_9SPHI|nr:penicillin-binding protein 2 [Pedobacter rhizosphaerae]SER57565.1 penicillin-binding protein 2 [Pedobacter rhizosphaerae]